METERKPFLSNIKTSKYLVFAENGVRLSNCEIHGAIYIGYFSYMVSGVIRSYSEIGRYCSIGRNVSIGLGYHDITQFSTSSFFSFPPSSGGMKLAKNNPKRRVIIGHDVWIGDNVLINSGITIGHGAIIGAGAVVTKDIPPYTIVGGIPAKIIKKRFSDKIIEELLMLEWWYYAPCELKKIEKYKLDKFINILLSKEKNDTLNYETISKGYD